MSGIFNPAIFNNAAFNIGGYTPAPVVDDVVKTGTGGIDPQSKPHRNIVKPLGTLRLPKKKKKGVEQRIDDSREMQVEIAARLSREFSEENAALHNEMPIAQMTMAQVEFEIGALLRKQIRTEDDEAALLILMIAAAL